MTFFSWYEYIEEIESMNQKIKKKFTIKKRQNKKFMKIHYQKEKE